MLRILTSDFDENHREHIRYIKKKRPRNSKQTTKRIQKKKKEKKIKQKKKKKKTKSKKNKKK